MRTHWSWILAAAITMSGVAFAEDMGDRAAAAVDKAASKVGMTTAKFPPGVQAKEADDVEDVQDLLGTAAEAALTKDGFDDLVERLNDQDRNRLGEGMKGMKYDDINAKVAAINEAWKAKYDDDFEVEHKDALVALVVIQGEVQDPKAVIVGGWPVPARMIDKVQTDDAARTAAAAAGDDGEGAPGQETAVEAANLEKGRELALATYPASHGLPGVTASLVGEAQGWRIDIPNTITAARLHENLVKRLDAIQQNQAKWPANENDASAMVVHQIILALYDVPMTAMGADTMDRATPAPAEP
jgi:hypothetical protein